MPTTRAMNEPRCHKKDLLPQPLFKDPNYRTFQKMSYECTV